MTTHPSSAGPIQALRFALILALTGSGGNTATADGVVRIMPLGDSITQGRHVQPGYRPVLWRRLAEAGYRVDFVGSLNDSIGGSAPPDEPDGDHEGHWGWRADEVLARIDGWAGDANPDIVLLHIGTNDIGTGEDPARTAGEVRGIIARLRDANPDVDLLLAAIIPLVYEEVDERIRRFNGLLEDLARALDQPRSRVVMVDQHTGFDARRDTYDGVHPNESGATKMADRWFDGLEPMLNADR